MQLSSQDLKYMGERLADQFSTIFTNIHGSIASMDITAERCQIGQSGVT